MRLREALQIIGQAGGKRPRNVHFLCGFTPLHLDTFIKAHLTLRFPGDDIHVRTGLYGDLEGNIERCRKSGGDGAIAIIEWSDLDQRLGFRGASGWGDQTLDDIIVQVEEKCQRIEARLSELGEAIPVALVAPTLGLPPLAQVPPAQTSVFELRLKAVLTQFLQRVCHQNGIRLASNASLAMNSSYAARHDVRMDLLAGFPYTLSHANAVADLSVDCLFPAAPKKGIITDLDQTLWKGILGDSGVNAISWSLEGKSQAHALYQQVLASLANSGVLVAIASKNDPEQVQAALQRPDILLQPSQIFPIEASWGPKSNAVARILEAWNIGADSVVFIDDSPMELAEVREKHPGIECLRFPSDDPAGIVALLSQLRGRFSKNGVSEEDRLRLQSLRASAALRQENTAEASTDFLARLEARLTLEASGQAGADQRAFELVNKTNQFNLNGVRYSEAEWKSRARRPGAFLATLSYEDRFGPLGRIAVLGGQRTADCCCVDIWVMSCRAFSRQIEFQSIRQLFDKMGVPAIRFRFKPTDRNGPLQTFFAGFFNRGSLDEGELHLRAADFERLCPPLFHEVKDKWTISETN
jgi:FkbH-like protein